MATTDAIVIALILFAITADMTSSEAILETHSNTARSAHKSKFIMQAMMQRRVRLDTHFRRP